MSLTLEKPFMVTEVEHIPLNDIHLSKVVRCLLTILNVYFIHQVTPLGRGESNKSSMRIDSGTF
jgi:hypothetical protein